MTHEDRVLQYIDDFESITTLQAMLDLGVGCLTKVVSNLRKRGINIETRTVTAKNRYGKPIHYAQYRRA